MRPIVLLGTGTNVGKTFVCSHLGAALRELFPSHPVLALKPVESGFPPLPKSSPDPASDAALLATASTLLAPAPHPLYALPDPISPHLAARRAGIGIDIPTIVDWVTSALHYNTLLLLETAGGALSPLSDTTTNLDLACALEPAIWVLVAPDALGVLHDVRATWTALHSLARPPDHLVLTTAREPDPSTGTNARELGRLGFSSPTVLPRGDARPLRSLAERLFRDAQS